MTAGSVGLFSGLEQVTIIYLTYYMCEPHREIAYKDITIARVP